MRRVADMPLWIGTARDARDIRGVLDAGIEAVVDLAMDEPPVQPTRELVYLRFPLVDGAGNPPWRLAAANAALEWLIRLEVPTLVACGGGMSRSVAITAAGLCLATDQRAPDMVLRKITKNVPVDVHPALWNDIMHCFGSEIVQNGFRDDQDTDKGVT
jgi:hypothetical protein